MIPIRDNVPSRRFPWINTLLIVGNVYSFISLISISSPTAIEKYIYRNSVIPSLFLKAPTENFLRVFTAMFIHGGWAHLIGNMLFLYIFGDNVEDELGHIGYAFFYIFCGICAALSQIYVNPESVLPMIGASGAIAGVLGAYIVFFPRAKVLTLVPLGFFIQTIEVPAFLFLGVWFIMQALSGTSSLYVSRTLGQDVGGVAWWAHAGGFLSGTLIAIVHSI